MFVSLARSLILALLWTVSAVLSVSFTQHAGGLALVWPANAILTTFLLIEPRSRHPIHIATLFVMSFLFNLWLGRLPLLSLGFSIAGLAEAVLAAWMIARLSPAGRLFDAPGNIFRFALIAAAACAPSALMAGMMLGAGSGLSAWQIAAGWMATHGSGMLITTPLLLILHSAGVAARGRQLRLDTLWRGAAMLGLVAAATTIVFQQTTYPFTFLIIPALLVATFHMRAPGAAGSVVIIAVIASWFTIEGSGPFVLMHVSGSERAYVMQAFLATMFLCALPLAAVLDQRDELAARTEAHLASIRGIADRIGDVLFRIDDEDRWSYLNPAYRTITGRSPAGALERSIYNDLPLRDHARIRNALTRLRAGRIPHYRFTSQIVDKLGTTRHVEFTLHAGSFGGRSDGVSGVFRDVTARTLLALQLHRDASSARRDARTDQLTRLPNRRAFVERLETRIESGNAMALALFDIDRFKSINDSFGHPAGDEVLRQIAETTSAYLREGDMIARIGGEEFAILIEDNDPAAAIAAAERLIAGVASHTIALSGDLTGVGVINLRVTISMGLARLKPGQGPDSLFAEADRALYAAKNGGRNQLKLAA